MKLFNNEGVPEAAWKLPRCAFYVKFSRTGKNAPELPENRKKRGLTNKKTYDIFLYCIIMDKSLLQTRNFHKLTQIRRKNCADV